ncbi:MAG TPA: hypothetical protein VKX16_18085, partial [Chloroflexota bacterium]|nr:hypothetical protein [Chloroflexota bacterium]
EFAEDPVHRLFLAELLSSYTHVASGSLWVQTPRGWRRRRYSELDPLRLLELTQAVPEYERPPLYRRLGDLALFLTGVFPDYAARRLFLPVQRERLRRAAGLWDGDQPAGSESLQSTVSLLEEVGRRAYHLAWKGAESGATSVLRDLAEGFGQARRVLNHLTDHYLFAHRSRWFGLPES